MWLLLVLALVLFVSPLTQGQTANKSLPFGKHGEFMYINVKNSSKGFEFNFDKTIYLVGNYSVDSFMDCKLQCVKHEDCLSGILVDLNTVPSSYDCLMFNWSSSNFDARLSSEPNSVSFKVETMCDTNNPCQNGGECIANTGPFNYVCNCTNGYAGRNCSKKCVLFDFESGRLDGWVLTGTAFNNQPTYGDNSIARGREPYNHKGDWSIGTYENRPSPSHPAGQIQGDGPIGTMTSPPFIIKGSTLKFRIGGGTDINLLRVELLIDGAVVDKMGSQAQLVTMQEKTFNVVSYREKVAQLRVIDDSSGVWGLINVDQFEDTICTE